MKLSEIIAHVGDEHIQVQNVLGDCMTRADMRKGGDTEIAFLTRQVNPTEIMAGKTKYVGLVIWLPKDRMP